MATATLPVMCVDKSTSNRITMLNVPVPSRLDRMSEFEALVCAKLACATGRHYHAGKLLADGLVLDGNKSIDFYSVSQEADLRLTALVTAALRPQHEPPPPLRLRGGGFLGVPFADLSNASAKQVLDFSDDAPEYREAVRGLNIEGECDNHLCEAYGDMVIHKHGYRHFDVVLQAHECKCPLCMQPIEPVTCGFAYCEWKFEGIQLLGKGQPPKSLLSAWSPAAAGKYERFKHGKADMAYWRRLLIAAREEQYEERKCAICHGRLDDSSARLGCGHRFHTDCLGWWKASSSTCPCCRAPVQSG